MLSHLRDHGVTPPPATTVTRSHPFEAMYHRDRRVERAGVQVPLSDISSYAALHLEDFREFNERALHAALLEVLAELLHLDVDDEEIVAELARFRADRRLRTDEQLAAWIDDNDLPPHDFEDLLRRFGAAAQAARLVHQPEVSGAHHGRGARRVAALGSLPGSGGRLRPAAGEVLLAAHPDFGIPRRRCGTARPHPRPRARNPVAPHRFVGCGRSRAASKDVSDVRYELVRAKLARRATSAALESLTGAMFAGDAPDAGWSRTDLT